MGLRLLVLNKMNLIVNRKNKILIVGAFPKANIQIFGGIITTCRILLNSPFSDHYELVLIDSTQISNPPPSISVRSFLAFKRFLRFFKVFFSVNPDAVLLFTAVGASVIEKGAMAWVARLGRIPIFLFPRGAGLIQTVQRSRFQRMWVIAAMRGATHILCQGPAWQHFAKDVLGFSEDRSPIVQNWTATEGILTIGESRSFTPINKAPCLLFLGWLEIEKGIFELLEASLSLSKKHDFRLIIAGRGHAEEQALAFVRSNGLEDAVEFAGWVDGEAKGALLAKADILILPSWAEGFPNAIIEAMAAKLAVVVTTVGNVPDLITDGQQALLVPPKDNKALELAIDRLLLEPQFRAELAERGHVFARDNFSVTQGVAKLTSVIDAAIAMNNKEK
jgi:glycosyltransferase involved in cell wall biosynthesis